MKKILVSVISVALFLPTVALGQGDLPTIPLFVYGNVVLYGSSAPIGAVVSVVKDGVEIASTTLTTAGKYFIDIPASYAGSTLVYKINGTVITQKIAANPATTASDKIDLTISAAPSGGGGYTASTPPAPATTTTITVTPLTAEQKVYDTNNDNAIDVLDFNALIVHWGETGTAVIADFDGNGVVDVFDFNALMVHWTA